MSLNVLKQVNINGTRFYQVGDNQQLKLYPSVTTILSNVLAKPGLDHWQRKVSLQAFKSQLQCSSAKHHLPDIGHVQILPSDQTLKNLLDESMREPDKIRDRSQVFGTGAHAVIEQLISTGVDDLECDPEYMTVKDSFRNWRDEVKKSGSIIIKTEFEVFSHTYGYAGTMDALLETTIDNTSNKTILTAVDWKTSSSIRNEYALQVAAYAKAYEEMTGTTIGRAAVVRFNKQGSPLYEVKAVRDLDQAFDAFCSSLHIWQTMNRPLF